MDDTKAVSQRTETARTPEDRNPEAQAEEQDYIPRVSPPPASQEPPNTSDNNNDNDGNNDMTGSNNSHRAMSTNPSSQQHSHQPSPIPTAVHFQGLQQQLYASEQNTLVLRHQAGHHINELERLVQTSWQRGAQLEAHVAYLTSELQKANAYNATLDEHVRILRWEGERKDKQLKQAAEKEKKSKTAAAAAAASAARATMPPPPLPMWDENTLLEHNRKTIKTLRAEIRGFREGKKGLEERLIALGESPAAGFSDPRTFLRWAEMKVPRQVLEEMNEVLVGKERKIVGLEVMLEREREVR